MQVFTVTTKKHPDEIKGYGIDFTGELDDGDSLASVAITVVDRADDSDCSADMFVADSDSIDGAVISAMFQAGTDGHRYDLNYLATTALGEKPLGRLVLKVAER